MLDIIYYSAGGWGLKHFCFLFLEDVPAGFEKVKETLHLFSPVLTHHLNHKCMISSLSLCFGKCVTLPSTVSVVSPPGPGSIYAGTVVKLSSTLPVHIPTHQLPHMTSDVTCSFVLIVCLRLGY